jgi:uncharacterized hydrophobic protein (TIGR00271 family)
MSWYMIKVSPQDLEEIERSLKAGSEANRTYFVLLVISTLIATFGLLANSTATVIGAMLIAPLMGPILGLGYALASGDPGGISRSLWTEFLGIVTCLGTAALVALVVRPQHIDYTVPEIVSRIHPTLYDLAVGLAAGLGGAYCSVHPRISASIAGVAISVALVPPLAVVGICAVGGLHGDVHWASAGNAGILFFTNFLTIELAAAAVFLLAGLRKESAARSHLAGAVALQLILLAVTAIFLYRQLHGLVLERSLKSLADKVISQELKQLPGSNIQKIQLDLQRGVSANFVISVTSRKDIGPKLVASFQKTLSGQAAPLLATGETVSLVIQSIRSSYASASSDLYVPLSPAKSEKEIAYQQLETALQKTLLKYPGVELDSLELHGEGNTNTNLRVLATVTSPYRFDRYLVRELEKLTQEFLKAQNFGHTIELSLRVLQDQVVDSRGEVPYTSPHADPEEKLLLSQQALVEERTRGFVDRLLGYRFVSCQVNQTHDASKLVVRLSLEGPRQLDESLAKEWERELGLLLSTPKQVCEVGLEVDWRMGGRVLPTGAQPSNWGAVETKLHSLVAAKGGWLINPPQGRLVGETLSVTCQVVIPETPDASLPAAWSKSLQKVAGRPVELTVQALTGKSVQGKP